MTLTGGWSLRPQSTGAFPGTNFINYGTITGALYNAGTFENRGVITLTDTGSNRTGGVIDNYGTMVVDAPLIHTGTINNQGTLMVTCNGTINSTGTITGNPLINLCETIRPRANPTPNPPANGNGWHNSDVTVLWNWTDNAGGSGIDAANCVATSSSSSEGIQILSATCTDLAGNTGNATYQVRIDKSRPTVNPAPNPPANANGWSNRDVTVAWNWFDNGSGVDPATCPPTTLVTGEGRTTLDQLCFDRAGNEMRSLYTVNLDKTLPTANPTQSPTANANGWNNSDVTVTWNWRDPSLSAGQAAGLDPTNCPLTTTTSGEGNPQLNGHCRDIAANRTEQNYTVLVDKTAPVVTITGVSNGAPVNHTLTFTGFNPSCASAVSFFGTNAPECAVRGGIATSGGSPISAGSYPGSPARPTIANDGHFVNVTLESLCGNGVTDAGFEGCDLSGANGAGTSCCTSSCQFRAGGQLCRGLDDVCDQTESCTGSAALCPADVAAPPTLLCRPQATICDLEDFCNGTSHACPADAPAPPTRLCRASSDNCDVDDFCDGASLLCGADNVAPTTTLCRPVSGSCDAQDFCDGVLKPCPTDQVLPSTVLCRATAGVCDVDDFCPGNAPDCSADAREPNSVSCRAIADDCDIEDFCDGDVDCPADVVKPDVDLDGLCDEQDNCPDTADPTFVDDDADGRGNVCDACTNTEPVDIVNPTILLRRIHTPASDDTLKFAGTVTVPTTPTIDPIAKGIRFRFEDPDTDTVLDVTIPGGAYNAALRVGWTATTAGWKYKNVGRIVPLIQGVNAITLTRDGVVPGRIKFLISGKKGFYPVFPDEIPLKVSMVIDSPFAQTGQCGEAVLTSLECIFDSGSTKLQCENPN